MKKRILSLFLALTLCLTLLPTAAFAEGETGDSMSGNTTIGGSESGSTGGGVLVPDTPSGGGIYEDTRTEIWRDTSRYQSIGRSYDGTTDGSMVSLILTFTDGTNEIQLTEGTDFTATKTFDSPDAGDRTVTVKVALIGDAATKYKLKVGEEKFEIGGYINKAYPDLAVSLSRTTCSVGQKLLPLLSVAGAPEDAEVTYYYLAAELKNWAGSSDVEGGTSMPKIDEDTAISEPGTYYVYAKTGETKNYEEERSTTVELTVREAAADAASVTRADGSDGGTFSSLPEALDAAQDGDTVKLLANHVTDWDAVDAGEYATLAVVKKTLTLDLNGFTVDYLMVGEPTYGEEKEDETVDVAITSGDLTVTDSSTDAKGSIIDLAFMSGKLTVLGGIIGEDKPNVGPAGGIDCAAENSAENITSETKYGGEISITGGTVFGLNVSENVEATVSGGTGHAGAWLNDGTLTITGGTFDSVRFRNNNGTIAISGGTFGEITNLNANGKISVMSLLADESAFYGKDGNDYTVLQDSNKTTLENVKVLEHTEHSFLNGACIACGALTCNEKNPGGEEGACIAHAVWSPYIGFPDWETTHIKTLDELLTKITDGKTWHDYNDDKNTATVTFLSDVTVDKTFLIDKYYAQIFLDLNGHTLSGKLQEPIITADFASGVQTIAIRNGTIENTGTGEAIRLERGRVTLENVNVTGDMAITYQYVNGSMYTAPFLGNGSFTRICPAANDKNGTWLKRLKDMLGEGCCFLDSADNRIEADQWFGSGGDSSDIKELVNVRVKACDHKDGNGEYTLFEDAKMSYGSLAKRCKVCGNLCLHDEITEGQNPTCVACKLPIVIKTTNLADGKALGPWYYTGLNDAMHEILNVNKGRRPTLELLADTESDSSYEWMTNDYDGIFIDLAGHTLKLTGNDNKASYWVTIQNTSNTHAEVRGTVNVYHKDSRSKLVILDTHNNLTIENVKFWDDGTAEFAGGSFGKITVPAGKLLASLLVSGYYFADSNSTTGAPAALYGEDGTALTELTNITVKPCSHDEAIYVPVDGGAWKCYCGQKTFVASITKDEATTYYTDLQEAFNAADGGTVKLMKNESGDVTVNTDRPFTLDLNGCNIFSLTVNSKITLKDSAETKGQIIEKLMASNGLKIGDLLEEGYAFRKSDGTWYPGDHANTGNASIQPVPILSVGLIALNAEDNTEVSTTMPYGTTGSVKLSASCDIRDTTAPDCKWYEIGGTASLIDDATGMNYFLPDDLTAVTHTYRVTFTLDGYSKSADITITVTPISLAGAKVAVGELTYNGEAQTPAVTVTLGEKVLTKDKDYTLTDAEQTNAGSYKLTVTGKGGYEGKIGNVDWKIEPKTVTNPTFNVAPCRYNGSEQEPRVELKDGDVVIPKEEYTVEYSDNVNAGNGSLTIQDVEGGNYVVSGSTTFPIEQASINTSNRWIEVRVFNELAKTYEVELQPNLDNILYEQRIEGTFGTVTYSLDDDGASTYEDYYELGTAKIENGKLILPIKNGSGVSSGNYIVTLMLSVESTNFKSFDLPVHIVARDKIVPRLAEGSAVSATDITYGQTLADSMLTVTGSMEAPSFDAPGTIQEVTGTFAWTDGTIRPEAGDYEAEWTFTPDASYGGVYANATGKVTVKVNPAQLQEVSVLVPDTYYYTGEPQRAGVSAAGLGVCGERPTFTYSKTENGEYTSEVPEFTEAGTYTVYYKAEAANHITATGTFPVQIKPLPISLLTVEKISKTYDGTASVTLSTEMLTFFSKAAGRPDIKLPILTLSFSNARFTMEQKDGSYVDSPEVGGGKALSFTMTLESDNYVFEREPEGTKTVKEDISTDDVTKFTITKADAPTATAGTLNVINGTEQSYTYDLQQLLPKLEGSQTYGNVNYQLAAPFLQDLDSRYTVDATNTSLESGILTLPVKAPDTTQTGKIGTLDVPIVTDNYQNFTLTLELYAVNKTKLTPGEITCSDITYGDPLSMSTISGTMYAEGDTTKTSVAGTFAWVDANALPTNGSEVDFTFTPDDTNHYEDYAGTVSIKVHPKSIEGATVTVTNPTYDGYAWPYPAGVRVELDGKVLQYQVDYTYPTINPPAMNAGGSHTLTIRGITCYTGEITRTWTIEPRNVPNPGLTVADGVYNGGNPVEPTVTLTDDRGKTIDAKEYTATFENNINAGTGTVTITDVDGGNYVLGTASKTFKIAKAESTAAAPTVNDLTYNGTDQALVTAGTANGGTMVYSLSETGGYSNQIPTGKDAGTYTVYYKVVGDDNHNDTTVDSVSVTIQKAKVTVTAENKSSRVGQSLKELSYTCVPALFDGDTFTGALACGADKDKVGSYEITRGTLALSGNYAVTFVKGTYTVEAKLQQSGFKFEANTKIVTYGDADFTFAATGAAEGSTVTYSSMNERVAVVDNDGTVRILKAGETTITAATSETADYGAAVTSYDLTVNKAVITIAAKNQSARVGDNAPALGADSYTVTGLVNGEQLKTAPTARYVDDNGNEITPDMTKIGEVRIAVSGAAVPDGDNYTISYVDGTLTITSRPSSGSSTTAPVITVPVSSDKETVKVDASVSNGVATVKATDRQLEQVTTDTDTITVDVSGLQNVSSAKLPSAIVEKAEQSGADLTVTLPTGSVTLDTAALAAVGSGKDVTVSMQKVALADAQRDAVGTLAQVAIVVDVNVLTGTVKRSDFNGGKLTVSIPYTLKAGEDPTKLQVWFIRDDGSIENKGGSYDRKTGCFVFSTEHLSCYLLVSTAGTQRFADVPASAYYAEAVAWAVKNGITGGISATTFDPNGFCTRAQAVTFLWRAAGSPTPESTAMPFTDVPAGSYYYDAVLWAIENDITKGTSDITFSPNVNCSRGQIVTFLWRSQKSPDAAAANPFTDVAADAYYTSAVLWAVEKSITGGTSATTFSPSANCTRAQIVTFIYRYMK